jgi:hypothetical protein
MKHLILIILLFSSQAISAQGLLNKIKSKAQEKIGTVNKSKKDTAQTEENTSEITADTTAPETTATKTDNDLAAYGNLDL